MKTAFIFTGQGVQEVGMGKDIYDAFPGNESIFETVNDAAGMDIRDICFNGPYEGLTDAVVSGMAVFAVSLLIHNILRDNGIAAHGFAGYSVGQYTALVAAGAIRLDDAARLIFQRGNCLKQSARDNPSGMLGIIGLKEVDVQRILDEVGDSYIANYNSPGNYTVSHGPHVRDKLVAAFEKAEAMQIADIPVEGGWHSPFMKPAAQMFKPVLETCPLKKPNGLFIDNYSVGTVNTVDELKENLFLHVYHPVKWHQSVKKLIESGVDTFIEIGYGNQLSKFTKFINRKVNVFPTGTVMGLQKVLNRF